MRCVYAKVCVRKNCLEAPLKKLWHISGKVKIIFMVCVLQFLPMLFILTMAK